MLFCVVALDMLMVCVSAFLESDMIMVGYPGGVISCAVIMACSSAMFIHVWVVPIVCGSMWMHVRSGDIFCVFHSLLLL